MDRRVLLVQGEVISRGKLAQYLRAHHYEVEEAATGRSALLLIDASKFDVVISDFRLMGGLTGESVSVHAERRWPGVIRVIKATLRDLRRSRDCGAVFVSAAIKPHDLLFKLELLLLSAMETDGLSTAEKTILADLRSQRATSVLLRRHATDLRAVARAAVRENRDLKKKACALRNDLQSMPPMQDTT
jgi:DNA-binding NtrC family response regulator